MIATLISRIFDPFAVLAFVFVLLFYDSPFFIPAMSLMMVLPFALFIVAWKTKIVNDWDVRDRRQRPKILWTLFVIEIMSSILLKTDKALLPLIALFGFAIITHFWKISGHMMVITLATGVVITRYGWSWWPVLFIIPLVGWARIATKNHTLVQVIAGTIYSWIIISFYEIWKSIF